MHLRHSICLLLGACVLALPGHAEPAPDAQRLRAVENGLLPDLVTPRTVPMRLQDRMEQLQVPGISVAVVDHGRLAWAYAWGQARPGVPMTPETLLQAASISKPVAAVAALRAVERGQLSLDADVNEHLQTWRLPPGAQTGNNAVTLRRLLSHGAGLTVSGFDGYRPGEPVPGLAQVLDGLSPANSAPVRVDIPPGTQWRYSGGGYVVMQQLLEDVSRQSFSVLMQREVLGPAHMRHSFFASAKPLSGARAAAAAVGYQQGRVIPGGYRIHPESAAAGLWTTPSDLARFSVALPRLLSAPMRQEALKPQFDESGLGFVVDPAAGRYGHDGSNAGFESRWLASDEDGGRAVVVMANANGTRALMNELIRAVATAQGWTTWMPMTQAALVGRLNATPVYVRGSLNDWGTSLQMQQVAPNRFAVTTPASLPVGPVEFKLASADWRTVDLGGSGRTPLTMGDAAPLSVAGANIGFVVAAAARYRFELDATDEARLTLKVSPVE